MARSSIPINSIERWVESWLGPRLRLALRALMVLLTNSVLCLAVLACIYVVQLIAAHFGVQGNGKALGLWTLRFLDDIMPALQILVVLIYAISVLATTLKIFSSDTD